MAYELNNPNNYSTSLTEISLQTNDPLPGSTNRTEQNLYKEVLINSIVTSPNGNNNPKKVWTVIADTTNYKVFGFYFDGFVAREGSVGQSDIVRWGIGYNHLLGQWFNDGLDVTNGPNSSNYAIVNPGAIDNYAEITSGSPDKFDFYMDIRSYTFSTFNYFVTGHLQIFANYVTPAS